MKHEIKRLAEAAGNSDHLAFHRRIKFCPRCGVSGLMRHDRKKDAFGKEIQGAEFWCVICGFSFNIRTSTEWNIALRIFKEHRQLRNGVEQKESSLAPEVLKVWKEKFEKPKASDTWPNGRGFSIADKLRKALAGK